MVHRFARTAVVHIQALEQHHSDALEELLVEDVDVNLFMLGILDAWSRVIARWYGIFAGERLTSVVLVFPDRLAVPWAPDPEQAGALGRHLRGRHSPCMVVGPRRASDAMWSEWAGGLPVRCYYDQRLYVCSQSPAGQDPIGFRRARLDEARALAINAGRMEAEDLGRDPYLQDPDAVEQAVRGRIQRGDTWVIEEDGQVVFQINVGTQTAWGTQIGGTYVVPSHRRRGLAAAGTAGLCRHLLADGARRVTLHVNEANVGAVRTYERVGFAPSTPFRLIAV